MDFFQIGRLPSNQVHGSYDLGLVVFSFIVAMFASYVALNIAANLKSTLFDKTHYYKWLFGGSFVMGLGIWTMHFIGMEAFITFIPMEYDFALTFFSLLIAIAASGFALFWVTRVQISIPAILIGGLGMGIAIASMHYVGMSAMMHINISYLPSLFFLSIFIAIIASQAALWLMVKSHDSGSPRILGFNILSAGVMGFAICGMHYVGMAAAVITPAEDTILSNMQPMHAGLPPFYVGAATSLIMIVFLFLSSTNHKFIISLKKNNEILKAKEIELDEARKRAEQANIAKSFFLANMSHEIRTPLNVIIGTASLLARSNLDDKEKKYVKRISITSRILLELIMDILDFSKIEAGKLKINLINCDFIVLINEVIEIMSVRAEERGLKLITNYDPKLSLKIISDTVRIQQIVTNLIGNAIKFTEKGYVKVNITSKQKDDDYFLIRLEVEDSGIGISEDKFDRLFQKFSQIDASSTRKFGGTGLGLVISKELVRLLGGEINFTSQVGKGSTFWFEIPFLIDKRQ